MGEDLSPNRKYSFIQNDQGLGGSGKLNILNALNYLPFTIPSFWQTTKLSRKARGTIVFIINLSTCENWGPFLTGSTKANIQINSDAD